MVPLFYFSNFALVGCIGMQILYFVVLSVIIALQNVPTLTLAKLICLLFHLM